MDSVRELISGSGEGDPASGMLNRSLQVLVLPSLTVTDNFCDPLSVLAAVSSSSFCRFRSLVSLASKLPTRLFMLTKPVVSKAGCDTGDKISMASSGILISGETSKVLSWARKVGSSVGVRMIDMTYGKPSSFAIGELIIALSPDVPEDFEVLGDSESPRDSVSSVESDVFDIDVFGDSDVPGESNILGESGVSKESGVLVSRVSEVSVCSTSLFIQVTLIRFRSCFKL